jgi:hypothetical protein
MDTHSYESATTSGACRAHALATGRGHQIQTTHRDGPQEARLQTPRIVTTSLGCHEEDEQLMRIASPDHCANAASSTTGRMGGGGTTPTNVVYIGRSWINAAEPC